VHFKVSFLFSRKNTRLTSRAARPIARLKDAVGQEDHSSGESPGSHSVSGGVGFLCPSIRERRRLLCGGANVATAGFPPRQMRHSEIHPVG
jgi:hypothetical protein